MEIILIRPPVVVPFDSISSQAGVPPLNLAYLAGSLKAHHHDVMIIDGLGEALTKYTKFPPFDLLINGLTVEDVIPRIPRHADILAVTCMFSNEWIYTKRFIKQLKANFPDAKIIIGGEHVTAVPEYCLRSCPAVDYAVLGEGEATIVELAHAISTQDDKNCEKVPGVNFIKDGKYIQNPRRARVKDVSALPRPDWETVPLHNYMDNGFGYGVYNKRSIPMLASRGCPYQCTFCTSDNMWTTKWFIRSPDDVIDEIKTYKEKYNVENIDFCDLTLITNKKWTVEFCQKVIQENLNITFAIPQGTRSEILSEEVLTLLKKAGLVRLQFAPESGSEETLIRIKKRVNLKKLTESIRMATQLGIVTKATLLFGLPGQTKKEVWESIVYLVKLAAMGLNDLACFPYVPYPGSELYRDVEQGKNEHIKFNFSNDDERDLFFATTMFNRIFEMKSCSRHIPHWWMPFLTIGGMAFFYFIQFLIRPVRLLRSIKSLMKSNPLTMFETTLYGIYMNFIKGYRLKAENR